MPDTELPGLTEDTAPASGDLILVDTNPGGGGASRKMTVDNLLKAITILAAETAPATNDELALYDLSAATADKITLANLLTVINALTEDTAPVSGDWIPSYDTSAAAAAKIDLVTIASRDGWLDPQETWTFATASTFTISGDKTGTYTIGTKLKLTQTTVKYFHVLSSSYSAPDTTVTVVVQTDYTLANAAISANFYSRDDTPVGFPATFNYTPTLVGFSSNPTGQVYRFALANRICTVYCNQTNNGTSNATNFTLTLPITAATITNHNWGTVVGAVVDNSVVLTTPGLCVVASAGTTMTMYKDTSAAAWTASGGKRVSTWFISYEV